jgi:hypothetical protein
MDRRTGLAGQPRPRLLPYQIVTPAVARVSMLAATQIKDLMGSGEGVAGGDDSDDELM